MDFLNHLYESIYQYAEAHTEVASPLLAQLERETHLKTLQPRMLSGHLQGRFLALLSQLMQPRKILEIGTFTGYSALCLAEGLAPDGVLHTIEVNPELKPLIQKYTQQSPHGHIETHIGDARDIVPTLGITDFDLVFIDAAKRDYADYYALAMSHTRIGALIIADNVLWSGKVTLDEKDRATQILDNFNQQVQDDPRVQNILLPLRDGLMLARKISA
jgi:caffeoyl-CoA O-methyltransferase